MLPKKDNGKPPMKSTDEPPKKSTKEPLKKSIDKSPKESTKEPPKKSTDEPPKKSTKEDTLGILERKLKGEKGFVSKKDKQLVDALEIVRDSFWYHQKEIIQILNYAFPHDGPLQKISVSMNDSYFYGIQVDLPIKSENGNDLPLCLVKVGFSNHVDERTDFLKREIQSIVGLTPKVEVLFKVKKDITDPETPENREKIIRNNIGHEINKEKIRELGLPVITEWVIADKGSIENLLPRSKSSNVFSDINKKINQNILNLDIIDKIISIGQSSEEFSIEAARLKFIHKNKETIEPNDHEVDYLVNKIVLKNIRNCTKKIGIYFPSDSKISVQIKQKIFHLCKEDCPNLTTTTTTTTPESNDTGNGKKK